MTDPCPCPVCNHVSLAWNEEHRYWWCESCKAAFAEDYLHWYPEEEARREG